MLKSKCVFIVNDEPWTPLMLERMAYERNLHMLHQLKRHGVEIKDGEHALDDDEIDYLTKEDAWRISVDTRISCRGRELIEKYSDSFKKSDAMWKKLGFALDRPMKISRCLMKVDGTGLLQYMQMVKAMQQDDMIGLRAHPEHLLTDGALMSDTDVFGIEPFGMYGTPTLVHVEVCRPEDLGELISRDRDPAYPMVMAGLAFLTDKTTMINCPMHQFRPTENGFEALTAVYWPEHTPDEIVEGHSLHLAMEFYEGLKMAETL